MTRRSADPTFDTPFDPMATPRLDPADVATAVRVLDLAPRLDVDDPDFETLKRAASLLYKRLKKDRRNAKTWAERKADRQVIESTATGSPMRIDDETKGIPLVSNATGAHAGELVNPRGCYICKTDYTLVDAFYHWLCPDCAARLARQARPAHRPHRQARAAHGRPRQDRDVHRPAAAPRRRPHDDHDALPQGRDAPLRLDGGQRPTGSTASRSSASTCATPPRSSRSPTR